MSDTITRRNLRQKLAERDGLNCMWCKRELTLKGKPSSTPNYATIEHIVRKADGGTNDLDNLGLACRTCNNERHGKPNTAGIFDGNTRKKWVPINKQAALITRKATGYALPPEPLKVAPLRHEVLLAEQKEQEARIKQLEAEGEAIKQREQEKRAEKKAQHRSRPKKANCTWAARWYRRLAKQKGLPKPTSKEVEAYVKKQPLYGEKI